MTQMRVRARVRRGRQWTLHSMAGIAACVAVCSLGQVTAAADPVRHTASTPTPVFAQPSGFWLVPSDHSGQLYGSTSPDANWNIAQWHIPEDLPAFSDNSTQNADAAVSLGSYDNEVNFTQMASDLICSTTSSPVEFDLFASPNNDNYRNYPSAAVGVSPSANLDTLTDITYSFTVHSQVMTTLDDACELAQGSQVAAVVLSDPTAGQTLFYEVRVERYRVLDGVTTTQLPSPYWYQTGSPNGIYGYGDNVTTYGAPAATIGTTESYNLHLLSRLTQLVQQANTYGMDQNLSDWYIRGAYYGQLCWSHMDIESQWSSFALTQTTS